MVCCARYVQVVEVGFHLEGGGWGVDNSAVN